ncbi:MAG TPA: DoxX family protein [Anaerolineales bacterium]|jgi:thiosulfate dehydrogenase [quinone] large subunit|nr:DoxX family protein [Anaerolineales bacterium]
MATVSIQGRTIQDPPFLAKIFSSPKAAWFWLILRVWVGYQWIEASLHKIGNPAWTQTGEALKGFWTGAVAIPAEGRPPIAFDWYRSFIQFMLDSGAYTWFAKLVAYGELLVGIALIVGAFAGVAAFFGAFMNWNFMMAGSASTNPWLFVLALGILAAWKIAGYIGFDYFLFPMISRLFDRQKVRARVPQTSR